MLHFSYKCIINIQLFIQDNPSSSTQVTQNDLNEFFSLKLDYGMIVFVSIAAILMAYFMIKHWLLQQENLLNYQVSHPLTVMLK